MKPSRTFPTEVIQVDYVPSRAGRGATCDRCGARARWGGLGGQWCPGHWSRRKTAKAPLLAEAAEQLALRYQVDHETLLMALPDAGGFVKIRPTTAPFCRLIFNPDPVALVNDLLASGAPRQRARLQLGQMNLALWGMALRWGVPLQDYPRDAQHAPQDIPWALVDWMEGDARAFQYVRITGLRLRSFCADAYGKDCAAGLRLSWLVSNTVLPSLPVQVGPLRPPRRGIIPSEKVA